MWVCRGIGNAVHEIRREPRQFGHSVRSCARKKTRREKRTDQPVRPETVSSLPEAGFTRRCPLPVGIRDLAIVNALRERTVHEGLTTVTSSEQQSETPFRCEPAIEHRPRPADPS